MEKRKLIKRIDLLIILGVLIVAAILLVLMYNNKTTGIAEISVNGTVVERIDLNTVNDKTFTLAENSHISFIIKNHMISFIDVDCPDKLCENVGYISKSGEIAICMPNKTTLKIVSDKPDVDIVIQ